MAEIQGCLRDPLYLGHMCLMSYYGTCLTSNGSSSCNWTQAKSNATQIPDLSKVLGRFAISLSIISLSTPPTHIRTISMTAHIEPLKVLNQKCKVESGTHVLSNSKRVSIYSIQHTAAVRY